VNRLGIPPRPRSCGKARYYSPDDAEAHRRSLEASDHAAGRLHGQVIVYWCDACQAFHVGHRS
jgi:hypothetical protein